MKAFFAIAGALGLAVVIGVSEPAPASTQPVTSSDVQVVSEQFDPGTVGARNGNCGRQGGRVARKSLYR